MSEVDEIVKIYDENVEDSEWVTAARAELAQYRDLLVRLNASSPADAFGAIDSLYSEIEKLRAKAAEYDRIKELVDLNNAHGDLYDQIDNILHDETNIALLDVYAETIRMHEIKIAEQERQLEEVRLIIELTRLIAEDVGLRRKCEAWLAANAPAQAKDHTA